MEIIFTIKIKLTLTVNVTTFTLVLMMISLIVVKDCLQSCRSGGFFFAVLLLDN